MNTKSYPILSVKNLANPVNIDRDNITADLVQGGTILVGAVKFRRTHEGWRMQLQVTVLGVRIHSTDAGEEEIEAFNELATMADNARMNAENALRVDVQRNYLPLLFPTDQSPAAASRVR